MIAEGSPFELSTVVETAGIVGNASAVVDWGDGTSSNATIAGGNATGPIKIVFDYSLDTSRFFGNSASDPRRIKLQEAADALVSRFSDTLTAVTPKQFVTVRPRIFHPSLGAANSPAGDLLSLPENPTIPANTIIVYAGARDLPGDSRGVGGGASISFSRTCIPGPQCVTAQANQDAIESRGQAGVLTSPATDVAPLYASISFDAPSASQFYFGDDPDGINPDQIDFLSVATHELAHAIGFGTAESWTRYVSGSTFTGPKASAAYIGNGGVPIVPGHWAASVVDTNGGGQPSLMGPFINFGVRVPLSPLDFAALDDIGWTLLDTKATVTASHRYADDGNYTPTVMVNGATIGRIETSLNAVSVTNVAPTLTVVGNQSVVVHQAISIVDIGRFTDPGFSNAAANPASTEIFRYSIDWGDGQSDNGDATIDVNGDASGRLTSGSFNGSHTYNTVGSKTVTVRLVDDNEGATSKTFVISVSAPPQLTLELDRDVIDEDAGDNAATLTVRRSGPASTAAATINLSSSDITEASLPASVVIAAGATFVTVPIRANDDDVLDGQQTVTIRATGISVEPASIELKVNDVESIIATLSRNDVREDQAGALMLTLRRSNTDTAQPLTVNVAGVVSNQFALANPLTIPANSQSVSLPINPINDTDPEPTLTATLTFTAATYDSSIVTFDLLDDELPKFQNEQDRFDVNGLDGVTALDSLRIINRLSRQSTSILDPKTEDPNGVFFDVNGDYMVTALDALLVINELGRRPRNTATSGESIDAVMQIATLDWKRVDDEDDESFAGEFDADWRLRDGIR